MHSERRISGSSVINSNASDIKVHLLEILLDGRLTVFRSYDLKRGYSPRFSSTCS